MIVPYVLSALISRCAPDVGPVTMSAVIVRESGGSPFAIGDNTAHRSYFPTNGSDAIALARTLLRRGHTLDLGYAQIDSANLAPYGLTLERAFDACANAATGAAILRADYRAARRRFGAGQIALAHALAAYNGGGYYASLGYARDVYATAAGLRYERAASSSRLVARGDGRAVAFRRGALAPAPK